MNKFLVAFALFAIAYVAGAPASSAALRTLPALRHEEVHDDFGQYALRYVTAEGTIVYERGHLVPTADGKDHVLEVEGEFTYIGADGKSYTTKYTSGLDGFRVDGDHIALAPEPVLVLA